MKCFRHDPGKVCPECGLDRRAKMKLKVQAQHLRPGDIVGSGEVIHQIIINSTKWSSSKIMVHLGKCDELPRAVLWGKYTMIGVERNEAKQ